MTRRETTTPIDAGAAQVDAVSFVSGRTRLFGIVGDPIEQVRSPEMVTAELHRRGADAILVPFHVRPTDFDRCLAGLLKVRNLDGLIFTIPFKSRAQELATEIGEQALIVGAINAMCRTNSGWKAEIFDGVGCVEAFRRHGIAFTGKRVMLIGAGGAGSAIAVAIAFERPASICLFDVDRVRAETLALKIKSIATEIDVDIVLPAANDIDILLNASPVGMLGDPRMPIDVAKLPPELIVFDAIVKPDRTRLISLAESCGCRTIYGREMMRGQISRIVDFFGVAAD